MAAKLSIPGGNGRMGKTLIKEIIENENLELLKSNRGTKIDISVTKENKEYLDYVKKTPIFFPKIF